MKRGGPLPRYTPLVAKTPLRRTSELRRSSSAGTSAKGKPAGASESTVTRRSRTVGGLRASRHRMPVDVAELAHGRSGRRCEAAIPGCWGTARELHHRVTQKAGGRHGAARRHSDRASNLMDLCLFCHLVITDHPKRAYSYGWSLREGQESTREPVLYRGDLSYLDDAGGVWSYEEAGA